MKNRIFLFLSIFIYFILIFFIEKIAFIQVHVPPTLVLSANEILSILYNGLPLDSAMAGYLSIIPGLLLITSIWITPKIISKIFNVYYGIILTIITIVGVTDILVYPHWGFHFDSTVFLYLQNPKESLGSGSLQEIIIGILSVIIITILLYIIYCLAIRTQILRLKVPKAIGKTSIVLLLLTGLLFLPIRGGVSVSTMNVGKVYFSDNMFLNHAAINPQFNLIYSFFKSEDFGSQYQFYDKNEASQIFQEINKRPLNDSIIPVLNTNRPNVILFILESFSANVANDSLIAPNISRFAKEGVSFTNFYANSFRTDRGLVSILSGYPAHPSTAIIKYPQKTQSLPAIPKSLKQNGYNLSFYYGGDADFANMRSYMVGTCATNDIISDIDFPLSDRMTKWGVPDKILLDRVYTDLVEKKQDTPFFKTVLTLSSHEPFDVPTSKFKEPFLNAVAYTDSCLGVFIDRLKMTDYWQNTLIIFVADHCMQSYPAGVESNDPKRFHIPMIWTGGAINNPAIISDYGSQNDLAATLLSQMKMSHDEYKFSKDMLNPETNKYAFYSYVNGFSMIDSTGFVIYDNDRNRSIKEEGNKNLERKAKAFFQNMYIDLGNR